MRKGRTSIPLALMMFQLGALVNAVVSSGSATGDVVPATISIGGLVSNTVTIAVGNAH